MHGKTVNMDSGDFTEKVTIISNKKNITMKFTIGGQPPRVGSGTPPNLRASKNTIFPLKFTSLQANY